ncbi:MAG TPA: GNAT family N-acetyltransferase [Candidatus Limnocylindrales bacterium]
MVETALDIYLDAFVAPRRHELDSPVVLNAPGVRGVALIRLLGSDDSGYDRFVAEVNGPGRGVVFVLDQAPRCNEFMRTQPGWSGHSEMAMVLRDIQAVSGSEPPNGLVLRPVIRGSADNEQAVSLKRAADVAIASDPSAPTSPEEVISWLSGLPDSVRVFAAVDQKGIAHATAACHVFGEYTQIFFVSTEPEWRRRGIGHAMTVGVLRAAASLGARHAILHATEDGLSVYKRIGFEPIGMLTRYSRDE